MLLQALSCLLIIKHSESVMKLYSSSDFEGVPPVVSIVDDVDDSYYHNESIEINVNLHHDNETLKISIYYSVDDTNNWIFVDDPNFYHNKDLEFKLKIPVDSNFTDGNHSIHVKAVDYDNLESKIVSTKTFSILPENPPPNYVKVRTPKATVFVPADPPNISSSVAKSDGILRESNTSTKPIESPSKGSKLTKSGYIAINFVVIFAISVVVFCVIYYYKYHWRQDESDSDELP